MDECSGAVSWTDSTFLTCNDDGPAVLYEVSYKGRLVRTLPVPGAVNHDWEDLATDGRGNVYISDAGNNFNLRRDLALYVCKPKTGKTAHKIGFAYPDQAEYPPAKPDRNFDCEAIFYADGHAYLVSKNRGMHQVHIYKVPTHPGSHLAALADSVRVYRQITGASLNPNGNVLALASYGGMYLYQLLQTAGGVRLGGQVADLTFKNSGQVEAVWFVTDTDFCLANEDGVVWRFTYRNITKKEAVHD